MKTIFMTRWLLASKIRFQNYRLNLRFSLIPMQTYTDIAAFLEHLAQGVEEGRYTKATFPKALDEHEWSRLINDLNAGSMETNAPAVRDTPVSASLVGPFQFLGLLPAAQAAQVFTYSDVASGLTVRLGLIRTLKSYIKDSATTRH